MTENQVKGKLIQIGESICTIIKNDLTGNSVGLYDGDCGLFVFLSQYINFDESAIETCQKLAEKIVANIKKQKTIYSYSSGFSGILYLFEFLNEKEIIEIEITYRDEIEEYLISILNTEFRNNHYDFLHGAIGIGFYFLKRRNVNIIDSIIEYLDSRAEKVDDIYRWKSILDHDNNVWGYNISLAHGITSIIAFLSKVIKEGLGSPKVIKMLYGAINYVKSQQIDPNIYGSYYPSQSKKNVRCSRLAWCYGDLGIAITLWNAGQIINDESLKQHAHTVLLHGSTRKTLEETEIMESGICHGSAGVSLIFRRMYLNTGDVEFFEASQHWLKRTLYYANHADGIAGYKTRYGAGWTRDLSLLSGVSGVGLLLLDQQLNSMQEWDELLLLSI